MVMVFASAQHIPAAIQTLAPLIHRYGYLAVGSLLFLEDFGILVPGETVLTAAAFFAGLGQLNILLVILIGIVASILGDNVGYAIGSYGGHPFLEKYGRYVFLTPKRIEKAENFFNKYGGRVVSVARFFDGLRELNGISAGISEMKWPRFLIFNTIGATVWVTFWALIGYYGGNHINTFLTFEAYLTGAIILLFILRILYKKHKQKIVKQNKKG